MSWAEAPRPLRVVVIAGEHSGDALGAKLIAALRRLTGGNVTFSGVGGEEMAEQGFSSLFPLEDVAVMGPLAILKRLPVIIRRVHEAVDATIAANPDVLVIIDSPEFTHAIAKRVRRRAPQLPIINYVSPSVWAWRPWRARRMRPYVDHVMALLPFEPAAHARLGGPPCSYVGHPLIERLATFRAADADGLAERLRISGKPVVVVLPGSRRSEVERLMQPFGEALDRLRLRGYAFEIVLPAVTSVRALIEEKARAWPLVPHLVHGEADKLAAFRLARAALAASGTVSLELGLAGTPAVIAYRVDAVAAQLRFLLQVPSVVLTNLVAGENIYPELLQEDCTPEKLAAALAQLLEESPQRAAQLAGLAKIPPLMAVPEGSPSDAAAQVVLRHAPRPTV
jgi:lipid-A-disaccharide synthase